MANVYIRESSQWRLIGDYVEPAQPDPDDPGEPTIPPEPTDPDRPALSVRPNESNTGPRVAMTGATLSGAEAIQAAISNGGVLVGRRIQGPINLTSPSHAVTFQDCDILQGGIRTVNGWWPSQSRPTGGKRAVFDHCRIVGGTSSSAVIGYDLTLLHCDISMSPDNVKPFGNWEMYACYLHDTWHPDGGHCDTIQVQVGDDILIHWCNLQGFNHPNSPSNAGLPNNAVLQNGGALGNLTNFRLYDNWVDGGGYCLQGTGSWPGYTAHIVFRRNKFGRTFRFGPISAMVNNPPRLISDFDSSNIYEDTGQPVSGG